MSKVKRTKIEFLCCHTVFDSDYRKKHNDIHYKNLVRQRKQIKYQAVGAFANPFQATMFDEFYNLRKIENKLIKLWPDLTTTGEPLYRTYLHTQLCM